jgi:hypothetical protein
MSSAAGPATPEAFLSTLASKITAQVGRYPAGSVERELVEQSLRGVRSAARVAEIEGTAGLRDFLRDPVRTNVAGMSNRIASNLEIHLDDFAAGRISPKAYVDHFTSAFLGDLDEKRAALARAAAAAAAPAPAPAPAPAAPAASPPPAPAPAPAAPPVAPKARSANPAEFFREMAEEQAHLARSSAGEAGRTAQRSMATLAHLADLAEDDPRGLKVRSFLNDPKLRAGLDVDEALITKLGPRYKGFLEGHVSPKALAEVAYTAMGHPSGAAEAVRAMAAADTYGPVTGTSAERTPRGAAAPSAAPASPGGPSSSFDTAAKRSPTFTERLRAGVDIDKLGKRGKVTAVVGAVVLAAGAATAVYMPDDWKEKIGDKFSELTGGKKPAAPVVHDATSVNSANGAKFDPK